jgi:polyhydroxyalkanoate synthase subunit PhaC
VSESVELPFTLPDDEAEGAAYLRDLTSRREKLEKLLEVISSPGHAGTGATAHDVIHVDGTARLLRMRPDPDTPPSGPPVLFVSAPVSRYFVLDLLPGRSFVGHVASRGHDVYLLDFGEPDTATRFADLDYYVNGVIQRAMRRITTLTGEPQPALVGYCLGGTLSLLYACLHPDTVSRLVLLTTTIDGDVKGGIPWVAHCLGAEGESYDDPRLVPAATVKSWFEMLAPGSNSAIGRTADLWARLDQPVERLRDVQTMATWVDDAMPSSGRLLAELFDKFGPGRNGLIHGTAEVNGEKVDLGRLTMPVLSVSAEKDSIAPPDGVDVIAELVPHAQVLRLPGGHVGIVAGRSAVKLWDITADFLSSGKP